VIQKLQHWLKKKNIPVRLIMAVIAGIVISKALMIITHEIFNALDIFPPLNKPMFNRNLLCIALAFHSFYAIVAAYVTAHIARDKGYKAVLILGSKEAIMWLLGVLLLWHIAPPWFNVTKAVLGMPLAILGGKIYKWRHPSPEQNLSVT